MKIAINGFGRIGRAIFRIAWERTNVCCVAVNEPNATIQDIVYFLKYDSLYGKFSSEIDIVDLNTIRIFNENRCMDVKISHYEKVQEYCKTLDADVYIIESCGKSENIEYYRNNKNVKVLFTFSNVNIDSEIIMGVNEKELLNSGENIISGSICDTVALAPVLKTIFESNEDGQAIITTMHPALNYQKVIDSYPDKGINRSLGRQYIDSVIPKPTSAENVLNKFYPDKKIKCMSFRIPTESVCAAEIIFISTSKIELDKIINKLKTKKEISFNSDDLVSIDFKASPFSATVDLRWTEIVDDNTLRMLIWYDNEYGYSTKILDLIQYWYSTKDVN